MRKIKKGDALNVEEISKTIEHILNLDSNSTMLPIKIFPKLKNYPYINIKKFSMLNEICRFSQYKYKYF